MSYSALIDRQVSLAFAKVKDLAEDAVFVEATAVAFDFNTSTASKTTTTPRVVKLVPIEEKKPNKKTNTIVLTVMGKATELGDLNSYSTVTFKGNTWKIGEVLKQTGRVWMFNLFREA